MKIVVDSAVILCHTYTQTRTTTVSVTNRKELQMTKTKSKYWGVQEGDEGIGFSGTFVECWEYLVKQYGEHTLAELDQQNIKVTRIK